MNTSYKYIQMQESGKIQRTSEYTCRFCNYQEHWKVSKNLNSSALALITEVMPGREGADRERNSTLYCLPLGFSLFSEAAHDTQVISKEKALTDKALNSDLVEQSLC